MVYSIFYDWIPLFCPCSQHHKNHRALFKYWLPEKRWKKCFWASTAPVKNSLWWTHTALLRSVQLSVSQYEAKTHSEQLLRQISSFIDAPIHGDEPLHWGLVSDIRVVQAGVQHDYGERENVACVCGEKKLRSVIQLFVGPHWQIKLGMYMKIWKARNPLFPLILIF